MELFEQFGVTQSMVQVFVLLVIIAIFLGMYWRYVAAGAGILFVIFVFTYKPSVAKVGNTTPVEVTQPAVPEVTQVDKWHKEFMEDCISVTGNSKSQCESIWSERIEDEKNPDKMAVNWKKYKNFKAKYL